MALGQYQNTGTRMGVGLCVVDAQRGGGLVEIGKRETNLRFIPLILRGVAMIVVISLPQPILSRAHYVFGQFSD